MFAQKLGEPFERDLAFLNYSSKKSSPLSRRLRTLTRSKANTKLRKFNLEPKLQGKIARISQAPLDLQKRGNKRDELETKWTNLQEALEKF
jgi:hypothetical protein